MVAHDRSRRGLDARHVPSVYPRPLMAIVRLALSVPLIVGALPACAIARPAPPPQAVAMAATASPARAPRAEPALLSRSVLFAPPDHADVKISPDGQRIGWLGPLPGGLNLWVGPADDVGKAQPVTQETTGSVRSWWWTFGSDRIVFARERADDESGHLYVVDVAKKETRDSDAHRRCSCRAPWAEPEAPQGGARRRQRPRQEIPRRLPRRYRHGRTEARAAERRRVRRLACR